MKFKAYRRLHIVHGGSCCQRWNDKSRSALSEYESRRTFACADGLGSCHTASAEEMRWMCANA